MWLFGEAAVNRVRVMQGLVRPTVMSRVTCGPTRGSCPSSGKLRRMSVGPRAHWLLKWCNTSWAQRIRDCWSPNSPLPPQNAADLLDPGETVVLFLWLSNACVFGKRQGASVRARCRKNLPWRVLERNEGFLVSIPYLTSFADSKHSGAREKHAQRLHVPPTPRARLSCWTPSAYNAS